MTEIHSCLDMLKEIENHPRAFPEGRVIFEEGEAGDVMFIVQSGTVELRSGDRVLETVGPGGILGEMALVDREPRSATAIAASSCSLAVIDEELFHALVRRVPRFALELMRVMARRLRRTTPRESDAT